MRHARRDLSETNVCEDKQTVDSFGVFEDISNLSIKLLLGSGRQMLSPASAIIARLLLFRSLQILLFSPEKKN